MNGALTPLVWAAAAVLVITALGIVANSLFFDHDVDNAMIWLGELVKNIIVVAIGAGGYSAYTHRKNGVGL